MAIDEIRQIVTAVVISEPLAERLGVATGSAGLHLFRHYKRAGEISGHCLSGESRIRGAPTQAEHSLVASLDPIVEASTAGAYGCP